MRSLVIALWLVFGVPAMAKEIPYESLRSRNSVIKADARHLPLLVNALRAKGYVVEIFHKPRNLPRSPYYLVQEDGEKPEGPALTLISHHTAVRGTLEEVIATYAFTMREGTGKFFNTSLWVDRSEGGAKPRIVILDGLLRTNHIAGRFRHSHAPKAYNSNTLGIEVLAGTEDEVQEAQIRALVDIAIAYSTVIHYRVAVYAHSEINTNKPPSEGIRAAIAARLALNRMKF